MTVKKTCKTCRDKTKCVVYHALLEAYASIFVAEIASENKMYKWYEETLERTAEICKFYNGV